MERLVRIPISDVEDVFVQKIMNYYGIERSDVKRVTDVEYITFEISGKCGKELEIKESKLTRCRIYSVTWVQDVLGFDANKTILDFNCEFTKKPKDSRYVKGLPKNGDDEYVGIYFEDPVVSG